MFWLIKLILLPNTEYCMIKIRAPYRILDCGGWTDTSFMPSGVGACCNVTVTLYVSMEYQPNQSPMLVMEHQASSSVQTIQLPFAGVPKTLAEAAAKALTLTTGGTITVQSDAPSGSGLGGSASYSVALLSTLEPELLRNKHNLAVLARELETKWLGNSCGTQDQMAAAFGGVSYSEIHYPEFT